MDISIRQILLSTDFSPPAQRAQSSAVKLAEQFGAELHIIHVVEDPALPVHGSRYSWAVPDDVLPRMLEKAEVELAQLLSEDDLEMVNQKVVRLVKVGHPVTTMVDYASQQKIDLIVAGTHGRSGFSHMLLGSVAEKLVRLATCPVLTVHPNQ